MQVQLLSLPPTDSWGCSSTGEHSARIRAMRVRFPSLPPRGRHQQGLARGCKPRRTGSVTRGGLSATARGSRPGAPNLGGAVRSCSVVLLRYVAQLEEASGSNPAWWWVRIPPYRPLRATKVWAPARRRTARTASWRSPRSCPVVGSTLVLRPPPETGGRGSRRARRPEPGSRGFDSLHGRKAM